MISLECGTVCSRDLNSIKADKNQLEAFEIWISRRILKISWKD